MSKILGGRIRLIITNNAKSCKSNTNKRGSNTAKVSISLIAYSSNLGTNKEVWKI
jgi:hypothetical protein